MPAAINQNRKILLLPLVLSYLFEEQIKEKRQKVSAITQKLPFVLAILEGLVGFLAIKSLAGT